MRRRGWRRAGSWRGAGDARPRGDRAGRARTGRTRRPRRTRSAPPTLRAHLVIPDILECLAELGGDAGSHRRRGAAVRRGRRRPAAHGHVGSRSTTPATRPRWRNCEKLWARRTLRPRGPRVPRCPPGKPSPMRSAAAANASARTAAGVPHPDRARCRPPGHRGAGQQGHRHTAFRFAAHRADPPHARLQQARRHLTRTTRARSCPPCLSCYSHILLLLCSFRHPRRPVSGGLPFGEAMVSLQCSGSNSMGRVVGPVSAVSGFHGPRSDLSAPYP